MSPREPQKGKTSASLSLCPLSNSEEAKLLALNRIRSRTVHLQWLTKGFLISFFPSSLYLNKWHHSYSFRSLGQKPERNSWFFFFLHHQQPILLQSNTVRAERVWFVLTRSIAHHWWLQAVRGSIPDRTNPAYQDSFSLCCEKTLPLFYDLFLHHSYCIFFNKTPFNIGNNQCWICMGSGMKPLLDRYQIPWLQSSLGIWVWKISLRMRISLSISPLKCIHLHFVNCTLRWGIMFGPWCTPKVHSETALTLMYKNQFDFFQLCHCHVLCNGWHPFVPSLKNVRIHFRQWNSICLESNSVENNNLCSTLISFFNALLSLGSVIGHCPSVIRG